MSSDTAQNAAQARAAAAADTPPALDAEAPVTPGNDSAVTLPARDREMLAFERQWWRYAGAKEAAIREKFGM
jgi:hypothetical protein